jgi:transposase
MPWKESNKMNEKVKFVARLLDGERMSDLCKEFGISRKSGYAINKKYET